MIRVGLATMLVRKSPLSRWTMQAPPVDVILGVDYAYRAAAERGHRTRRTTRRMTIRARP